MFEPHHRVDRAFFGDTDEVITPEAGSRKMIGFGMGLYGWKKSSLEGNTLRGFLRDFRATDDVITNRRDPLPAVMMPIAYIDIARMCFKYKVGLAEAFMHDHEWDGIPSRADRPSELRAAEVDDAGDDVGLAGEEPAVSDAVDDPEPGPGIVAAAVRHPSGGKNRSCSKASASVGTSMAARRSAVGSPAVIQS